MSASAKPVQPFRFLDLPAEIRVNIFSQLLHLTRFEVPDGEGED